MLVNAAQYDILKKHYGRSFPSPYIYNEVYNIDIRQKFNHVLRRFKSICYDIEQLVFDEEYKNTRKLQLLDDEYLWFSILGVDISPNEPFQIYVKDNIRVICIKNIDIDYDIITTKIARMDPHSVSTPNYTPFITVFCNYEHMLDDNDRFVKMMYNLIETMISVNLNILGIKSIDTVISKNTIVLNDRPRITDANFVVNYYLTLFKCLMQFLDLKVIKRFSDLECALDYIPKFCLRGATMEMIWRKAKEDINSLPESFRESNSEIETGFDITKVYYELLAYPMLSENTIKQSMNL